MPDSRTTWADVSAAVNEALADADDVLAVNPPAPVLHALLDADTDADRKVLVHEDTAKPLANTFGTATRIADLRADDALDFRADTVSRRTAALVAPEFFVAFVEAGDEIVSVRTDGDGAHAIYTTHTHMFDDADAYPVDAPARSTLLETLTDEFDDAMAADFDTILDAAPALGTRRGLNTADAVLLLAAKHETLFYDVSQWGESVDLASKATFSRAKTRLEDADLIDTVKVPIDVGRPRLRLQLPDAHRDASAEDLVDVARNTLLD